MLDKQMLLKLAVNLLRTVNDLAEYADIKKLCEVREMTIGAAATLENFTISSPEGDLPTFENYRLAENFETIFKQLSNLRLLVDERPKTAAKGAERDLQGDSEPQMFSAPETAASLKPSDRTEPNFDLVNQLDTTNPEASSTTKPIQQQQQQNQQQQLETKQKTQQLQDPKKEEKRKRKKQERENLKKHWAIGKSQNALELYFDGVKPKITKEHLLAHFACFGQVLDVYMLMDYSGKNHRGWSYITLLPAGDPNQILKTEHAINGVKINLRRCYQFCDGKMRPMKTAGDNDNQNVNVEPLPLKGQVKAVRSKAPMPTEPVTQPQKLPEQQRDLRKHQAADKSQKSLKLFFDGLKLQITLQELKAHFAHFGEVLDVTMFMNPVTNRQNGNGYITLRPIADRRQILDTEHFIQGSRINVRSAK
nr:unnamed protein product [Spirometra erinaceieuropaei]